MTKKRKYTIKKEPRYLKEYERSKTNSSLWVRFYDGSIPFRLELGDLDAFGRPHVCKKTASVAWHKIFDYWENSPLYESFINKSWLAMKNNKGYCMACGDRTNAGKMWKQERAHITASSIGGSNKPSNLHCLCRICHSESEGLKGYLYWLWLGLKSQLYEEGDLNSYEYDYPNEKKGRQDAFQMTPSELVPWLLRGDSEQKIKDKAKDISLLMAISTGQINESQACFTLHNFIDFNFKCEFKNVDEIYKIDEWIKMNDLSLDLIIEQATQKMKDTEKKVEERIKVEKEMKV